MFFQTVNIHFIDLLVIGFLAFGAYKGYKLAWIILGIDLLVIILGFYVTAYFSNYLFLSLLFQGLDSSAVLASLLLAGSFIVVLWISHLIQNIIKNKIKQLDTNFKDRIAGIILGMIKYLIIIGVFTITIKEIDNYTNFLPKTEKIAPSNSKFKSILGTGVYYMITAMSPAIKFEHNRPLKKSKEKIKYIKPKSSDFFDNEF